MLVTTLRLLQQCGIAIPLASLPELFSVPHQVHVLGQLQERSAGSLSNLSYRKL